MKKKGFTLIELLVVISIIALLLAILMPALSKVKKLADRLMCGTNLKGLGTAINVYAFDYNDDFPVQGRGTQHIWAEQTGGWQNSGKNWGNENELTVAASLYMLVRGADVSTASFVCRGGNEKEFDGFNPQVLDIVELWDFGGVDGHGLPKDYVSYSYQQPYYIDVDPAYPASANGQPTLAIMADKNPWADEMLTYANVAAADPGWAGMVDVINFLSSSSDPEVQVGNSAAHEREGQNVLFNDAHVKFEKRPDVAVQQDNIYTRQPMDVTEEDHIRIGTTMNPLMPLRGRSRNKSDSVLVNDSISE